MLSGGPQSPWQGDGVETEQASGQQKLNAQGNSTSQQSGSRKYFEVIF